MPVSDSLKKEEVYYAILYYDDGDGQFHLTKDTQVVDTQNSVILMNFVASEETEPELGPVTP